MINRWSRIAATFGLILLSLSVLAETAYVIDRVAVGIHADRTPDSAIIKVYPTGTELEVIKQEDDIAQVKAADGTTGWIEIGYLMPDPPASELLAELKEKNRKLESELDSANESLAALRQNPDNQQPPNGAASEEQIVQLAAAQQQVQELEQQLASQQQEAVELNTRLAEAGNPSGQVNASDETNKKLRSENEQLKEQLQAAKDATPLISLGNDSVENIVPAGFPALWILVLVLIILLLGPFLGGIYWMDRRQRRRHGGFRL